MVDPNVTAEQTAANLANVNALQTQASADTASLMARYGTKMALANVMSPAGAGSAVGKV